MDFRLELVQVPVSDVDRALAFYVDAAGFVLDMDADMGDGVRYVQLTPKGSRVSIAIGSGLTSMTPGSLQGLQLVVYDLEAARAELADRGVQVSDVRMQSWGRRFVTFTDPDGNGWTLQQVPIPF